MTLLVAERREIPFLLNYAPAGHQEWSTMLLEFDLHYRINKHGTTNEY